MIRVKVFAQLATLHVFLSVDTAEEMMDEDHNLK